MKYIFIILTLALSLNCSKRQQNNKNAENSIQPDSSTDKKITKTDKIKTNNSNEYLTSTYDNPEFADKLISHRETLKKLSNEKVFSVINNNLIHTLTEKHRQYFKTRNNYELISVAKGDLFLENKEDYVFVIYDKKYQRVSILLYKEKADAYSELYRDIKIENGLKDADCNFGAFGTLDYQLAEEIVYQEVYLLKRPEGYLEYPTCKIADISKDEDFVLESGCFSKKASKNDLSYSLCISTSSVYSNWECLKYNKATETFLIFYGQAFAD